MDIFNKENHSFTFASTMATPHSVAFHTLGCKLNFSETSSIRRQFEDHGYRVIPFEDGADIYVINTCSVTEFADRKCRYEVRRALGYAPDARVIVIGCYAQLKPKEIADIPGVDLVLGAAEKFNILHYVNSLSMGATKGMVVAGEIAEVDQFESAFSFGDRTRTFLKVQDGCNYKCSFCTIPKARGKSRSDSISNVIATARQIVDLGSKEIVLTGVNTGDFQDPVTGQSFIDLIKALDTIEGIERIRISSIEPNLCHNEVIDFVASSKRFVPHLHMPLQSGSNKILKLMRRRYARELYADRVAYIKEKMPHCCIGVDVIVGFPGETEEDFLATYHFLKDLDISYLHVFTYSERDNTHAPDLPDSVPMNIRKERNKMLRILSDKKRRAFEEQFTGTQRPVLWEYSKVDGMMCGFTDNYIKLEKKEIPEFINTVQRTEIET